MVAVVAAADDISIVIIFVVIIIGRTIAVDDYVVSFGRNSSSERSILQ